jgi:hypothetical protein
VVLQDLKAELEVQPVILEPAAVVLAENQELAAVLVQAPEVPAVQAAGLVAVEAGVFKL